MEVIDMKNIAIIGCGYIGKMHAAAIKKSNKVNLTAIVHSHEDAGKNAAEEFGCKYYATAEELFAREPVDIVNVCLPSSLHEQYVVLAAKNNKHVICEKPFSLSSVSAQRMKDACDRAGVKLMIAQVLRWMPEFVKIKDVLDDGVAGNIHMVYSNRLAQHPNWTKWHRDVRISGGGLFDIHLHDIDYLYSLFGKLEDVYAVGWKSSTGCWNHVISTLKFKNGVKAVSEGSSEMIGDFPFSASFRITGDKATIEYNLMAGFNIENLESANTRFVLFEKDAKPKKIEVTGNEAFQAEIEDFAAAVEENKPPPILPEDSVYVIKIIEALHASLESGEIRKVQ
ncbi:MAG: Gfo/Idh/MocA family oxidoreductase [Treponema sp.]|jgi:predicted dehydrogenase|nr:Gfo/Idh/MocA family oxidoreductase [Treponema sp.]